MIDNVKDKVTETAFMDIFMILVIILVILIIISNFLLKKKEYKEYEEDKYMSVNMFLNIIGSITFIIFLLVGYFNYFYSGLSNLQVVKFTLIETGIIMILSIFYLFNYGYIGHSHFSSYVMGLIIAIFGIVSFISTILLAILTNSMPILAAVGLSGVNSLASLINSGESPISAENIVDSTNLQINNTTEVIDNATEVVDQVVNDTTEVIDNATEAVGEVVNNTTEVIDNKLTEQIDNMLNELTDAKDKLDQVNADIDNKLFTDAEQFDNIDAEQKFEDAEQDGVDEYEGMPELEDVDYNRSQLNITDQTNITGQIFDPEAYQRHVEENRTGFLNIFTNPVDAVRSLALSVADPSIANRIGMSGGNNSNEKKKVILVMSCLILLILNKKK